MYACNKNALPFFLNLVKLFCFRCINAVLSYDEA